MTNLYSLLLIILLLLPINILPNQNKTVSDDWHKREASVFWTQGIIAGMAFDPGRNISLLPGSEQVRRSSPKELQTFAIS